ncbi:MAG: hypothetical protein K1X92_13325 [Bacteroidia bacterium]|nr:hypothetical protein [Bacteroidia bacterium]
MNKKLLILLCLLLNIGLIRAQYVPENTDTTHTEQENPYNVFPKSPLPKLKNFSVSGYYRFLGNVRNLKDPYPELQNNPLSIFIGDDSQIPQLMLNLAGKANDKTSFYTDLFMWAPMMGGGTVENVKGLNLGVSMTGTHSTRIGNFKVLAGGINWYSLSPFTFYTNKGYNRFSIFERNPWDPNTKGVDSRYADFYNTGALNQDKRWGQQAFQGIILEGNDLPKGFSAVFMYGKTQLNGGFQPLPNSSTGGRIKKTFKDNFISLNSFNNLTTSDSIENKPLGFNIHTMEFEFRVKKIKISGEAGAGRFFSESYDKGWGESVSLKVLTPKEYTGIPIELHAYQISPKVINNSSVFWNSAIREGNPTAGPDGSQLLLVPFASSMVPVGQLTNNRRGIELNSEFNVGKLKFSVGNSISEEIENISSQVTYSHPANNLTLSRFWRWGFPGNVGPYGNLTKVYRGVFETLTLTDVDAQGKPLNKKRFNTMELNAKYNNKIFKRDFYVYYLLTMASLQKKLSPIMVFTEKAYLRTYYHQMEFYYRIFPNIMWTNYVGYERIIANYDTKTDVVSRRPKNQTGLGLATGIDLRMSKNAGLYLRQRWFNYKDTSFALDHYKGTETTVEIKIFF